MNLAYRAKRVVKEALGLRQYPRRAPLRPEELEQQLYSALLRPGDTCFDVGANIGDVSLYLARVVGPEGAVFAFEPVIEAYRELCRNLQGDGYEKAPIMPVSAGLSDTAGTATIAMPAGALARASMAPPADWAALQGTATISRHECEFTTLDRLLLERRYPTPSFMKIDVEGAELRVLRGGSRAFDSGFRPLMVIELFAPWERAFGYGPWDVLSFLSQLEYRFLFVCPAGLVEHTPTRETPFPRDYEAGYNIVAYVPAAHDKRVRSLDRLRKGSAAALLPMAPAPMPNQIVEV